MKDECEKASDESMLKGETTYAVKNDSAGGLCWTLVVVVYVYVSRRPKAAR